MNMLTKSNPPLPLEPASVDQAAAQVARMFGLLHSQKKEGFSEAVAKEYLDAIQHQPLWAIEKATTKFVQGSYGWVPDRDRKFVPVVAVFAEAVRSETLHERQKRKDLQRVEEQRKSNEEWRRVKESKTPEARAGVDRSLQSWKESYMEHQAAEAEKKRQEKSIFEVTNERLAVPYGKLAKETLAERGS